MSELALKLIAEAKEKSLTRLDLGKCGLIKIPDVLFELVWLEELSLSNEYYDWENEKNITSKNKGDDNQLSELPQSFSKLKQLNKLILSGDKTWEISDVGALSELSMLTTLNLDSNQIRDVSGLSELSMLITLYLSNNQIRDVNGLSELSSLTTLDLSSNQISDVRVLSELATLTSLDLSSNQISDLRVFINNIKKGAKVRLDDGMWEEGIFVRNNPLEKPPIEVIEQGNSAILSYFQDLEQQGEGKLNEAKLIGCGCNIMFHL